MIRDLLRPATTFVRSLIGTNGIAAQIATIEAKIDALSQRTSEFNRFSLAPLSEAAPTVTPLAPLRPPPEPHSFVKVTLPTGATYEISIAGTKPDDYHRAVASEAAYDANWHFLNAWLRPGDVFFDLGANIGTISIPAAVNGAVVHSFELLDENVQHLVRSVQKNSLKRVSIVLGAVSDQADFLGIGGVSAWGTVTTDALVSIPSIVIDSYVHRKMVRVVDVMKVDVEGSEKAALLGATNLINRDHPDILLECNAVTCGNHAYSYRDLLRFLESRGYQIYRLQHKRLCPWSVDKVQEVVFADYFATTKNIADVFAKSGWSVSEMTTRDVAESIITQEQYGSLHMQYVLAITPALPALVLADERVAALMARWTSLRDPQVISILQIGSA